MGIIAALYLPMCIFDKKSQQAGAFFSGGGQGASADAPQSETIWTIYVYFL